ncbi:thioredoxin [Pseudidiomarina sp. GXY010]|uniref:Thioredoxin n=1 Tax=Pseudidiomarina fusca TaxID=2965078 RepID=A0ABU3KY39_9GAMM|nr:thioredoxin [Pseudidiomarina sp. GXY010]MDT7526294.1 thioredoxin [Pseudidiomarina sp. GXY010]
MHSNNIIQVTAENFQQVILQGSEQKLVIVDFWADWCEPCKQLMPILEKLAAEYANQVILAKINCDEQQHLAAQFGIRSLPTVAFFKDGQAIDGFAGVESEAAIRNRITQHIPSIDDELFAQAQQAVVEQDYSQAFTLAKQALDLNPNNIDAKLIVADAACELGRIEHTKELLSQIKLADQNHYYQSIQAKLHLAEQAADSPELRELDQQLQQQPDNHQLRLEFAAKLFAAQRIEEALDNVFAVLIADLHFANAKQQALDMLNSLPNGDPLAAQYRRRLYSMLY